jgi:hypothetical protein
MKLASRLIGFLLLTTPLLAERVAYLVRFGVDDKPDVDWSGSITPAPARLSGWQFDARDQANGDRWKCTTRQEAYWDTPYERSMKGTSRKNKVTRKGIVVDYDDSGLRPRVSTAHGAFEITGPGRYLNGRVEVTRTASVEMLTRGPEADDHPSLYQARDGTVWLAWQSYSTAGDMIWTRRWLDGRWSAPEALSTDTGDCFRTAISQDKNGKVWVFWSAQENGNFDLYGRVWDGSRWSGLERITTALGSDIYHVAAADKSGTMHLAWMSPRSGNFDIYSKSWDGRKWSAETRVSPSEANDWEPALAPAPDGSVAILWDTYDRGNYDVVMRTLRGGKLGPVTAIADSGAFEARVSAQFDKAGALWLAWDEGDWNWGKDYGQAIVENGRGLLVRRQARLARWMNGKLEEPSQPLAGAMPEDLRQVVHQPKLVLDGNDNPCVLFRYRVNLPIAGGGQSANRGSWRQGAACYVGSQWNPAWEFPTAFGRIDAPAAAVTRPDGKLLAVWQTDSRTWPHGVPGEQELAAAVVSAAAAAKAELAGFRPSSENLKLSHAAERVDLRRVRNYRTTIAGKQYRIVRGDIHRHTDVSWDGNRDGSLHDAYRYALDAAGFEYMGVCDHQAGNMIPYNWWMIQKAVDLFSIAGRFAPLYSYERSLPYPNGHRNVLFAKRGRPVLAISPAEQKGTEGAGKLYAYLRQFGGLTSSHTSATGAGTDWRDSSEDLEPVVEIYQGYRRNYEGPGTPRAPAEGEEPSRFAAGYVWNAWNKGIKLGVQSSSDHVSTHISYGAFYVESVDRDSILGAIRARRTYAATDNIVVDFRYGNHFMGESVSPKTALPITARVEGTGPLTRVSIVKNGRVVYAPEAVGQATRFTYTDRAPERGTSYYYLRVEQQDGQIAWSSPVWVTLP